LIVLQLLIVHCHNACMVPYRSHGVPLLSSFCRVCSFIVTQHTPPINHQPSTTARRPLLITHRTLHVAHCTLPIASSLVAMSPCRNVTTSPCRHVTRHHVIYDVTTCETDPVNFNFNFNP
jgi:hypothetical protein